VFERPPASGGACGAWTRQAGERLGVTPSINAWAVERADADLRRRLAEEGRSESEEFIEQVASTVGLAAVKYADLSQNRTSNYQFSFDRMLALQGNTAPYLLYAVVRIAGIARKGGDVANTGLGDEITGIFEDGDYPLTFTEPQEWALVRHLLGFDAVIAEVEEELLPNRLCSYLFELSQVFNRFYDQVPVLKAPAEARGSRLALCRLTADTLKLGLGLLGIPWLERM
jgi:arginyl-tRNA synthetase